jgi:hypothetical protein
MRYLIALFSIFVFILMLHSAVAAVVINEIMPNPADNCSDCSEWVELYSDNNVNLTGFVLDTTGQNLSLNTAIQDFLIVTGNKTKFLELWPINGSKVIEWKGISLANSGDNVSLYNNSILLDSTIYPSFSSDENKSWARCNGNWSKQNEATPGAQNNCSQQQEKRINLTYPSQVQCNENFTITLNAFNFENGIYDAKIDMQDVATGNRIGQIWNGSSWLSTYSYVNSALNVTNGNGSAGLIFKIENFNGSAILLPRLRLAGSSTSEEFAEQYLSVQCSQQEQEDESSIKIKDAPDEAVFGDTIDVEARVYKGDTSKYAVYFYVEDGDGDKVSDKITLHFETKFSNQTASVELQLKCLNESGDYEIVVEGLDTEDREEIHLDSCDSNQDNSLGDDSGEGITLGDFTYSLTVPNAINISKEFAVKVKIASDADQEQNFLVWSYVYSGNNCLSCNGEVRESNAKSIIVLPDSDAEIELKNIVTDTQPGTYKLKVKVLQEGLKTPKEFTYNVSIQGATFESDSSTNEDSSKAISSTTLGSSTESNESRVSAERIILYIFITLCALFVIFLIIKKI